jgi:hypothetical protein
MDSTSEISAVEFFEARLRFLTTPSEVRTSLSNGSAVAPRSAVGVFTSRRQHRSDSIPG